jgi:hypothetical protein
MIHTCGIYMFFHCTLSNIYCGLVGEEYVFNIKLYVLFTDNVPLNIMNCWSCSKIISNSKNAMTYNHYFECNYNQMSQWWQRTPPQMGLFLTFWFFQRKEFLKDFFCNIFFKMLKIPPINYITCVNYFFNKYEISKSGQILLDFTFC